MKIQRLTTKIEKAWDNYVLNHSLGNFYQLSGWSKVYASVFQFIPQYYCAVEGSEIVGVMPLFLMRNILGKPFLVSIPFSSYAGVCFENEEAGQFLLKWAKHLARKYDVEYVEFRQYRQSFGNLPCKDNFVTMVTPLERNYQDLWDNTFKPKLRSVIRQGEKNGLVSDWGRKYLDDFYFIFKTNMKRLGTPVHPPKLFSKIIDVFKDKVNISVVKYGDKIIAGMFTIDFNGNVFADPWASSLWEYNHLRPNNVLYWNAIKYACDNGFENFDFGRSTIGGGTYLFKKHWGAKPLNLPYEYYLHKAKSVPQVDANNNKYELLVDIWKKLPISLATSVGKRVVKYLPEL